MKRKRGRKMERGREGDGEREGGEKEGPYSLDIAGYGFRNWARTGEDGNHEKEVRVDYMYIDSTE